MYALHPPLSVVETWTPNYTNPVTGGESVLVVIAVLGALGYVVVALRLWARFVVAKNAGIDDALIIFNMVPLTGFAVAIYLGFKHYGFNKHVWDSPTPVLMGARKLAIEALYMVSTVTTKISILLFYRRLAAGCVSRRFIFAVYAAISFVVLYFLIWFTMLFYQCRPLNSYWKQVDYFWYDANKDNFICTDEGAVLVASAVVSAIQDFIACGMPMVLFWKLHIPRKQKIALAAIFAVGIFLCVSSIVRLGYVIILFYKTWDMTWACQPAYMWLAIEAQLSVMCASAPALKIYFKNNLGETSTYNSRWRLPFNKKTSTEDSVEAGRSLEKGTMTANRKKGLWDVTIDEENEEFGSTAKAITIVSSDYDLENKENKTSHGW